MTDEMTNPDAVEDSGGGDVTLPEYVLSFQVLQTDSKGVKTGVPGCKVTFGLENGPRYTVMTDAQGAASLNVHQTTTLCFISFRSPVQPPPIFGHDFVEHGIQGNNRYVVLLL